VAEQLPQDSKRETDHEAMVRWQGYAREHRSTVNSLFLTYAAALFGLQSSILLSKDVTRVDWSSLFIAAAVAALVSLIAGGIVVVLRLEDARQTARIVRYRIEQESQSQIDALRDSTNKIGGWTNFLIPVQFIAFALAALTFLIWLFLSFRTKLSLFAG
jgi:ribose/xylose/arabinose/galactoside ABC-type transport system permease subunit